MEVIYYKTNNSDFMVHYKSIHNILYGRFRLQIIVFFIVSLVIITASFSFIFATKQTINDSCGVAKTNSSFLINMQQPFLIWHFAFKGMLCLWFITFRTITINFDHSFQWWYSKNNNPRISKKRLSGNSFLKNK